MIVEYQRRSNDCGVAALATFLDIPYVDIFIGAVAVSDRFARHNDGLTVRAMLDVAAAYGRPLKRLHYRRVDLYEHVGVLGINWHQDTWRIHGGSGHWVVLRCGTVIDPSGPSYHDPDEYLTVNRGRVGTLLQLVDA